MNRKELIAKLQIVEPALSENPILPILQKFWFNGEQLLAYNDRIAIATPLPTNFKGAVDKNLLALLLASHFEDLTLAKSGEALLVKDSGGRTAIKLALDDSDFIFKMPRFGLGKAIPDEHVSRFIECVDHCMLSVGNDTSVPEHLGVTLSPEEGKLFFYSTDTATISRAKMPAPRDGSPTRAIMRNEFCKQAVRLYGSGAEASGPYKVEIAEGGTGDSRARYSLLVAGKTVLYGRILETSSPLPFDDIVGNLLPSNDLNGMIDTPARFHSAVDRASIICDGAKVPTTITVEGRKMSFLSKTEKDEVKDAIDGIDNKQKSIEVKVEPKYIKRAPSFSRLLIRDECVIMATKKGDFLYLVACH